MTFSVAEEGGWGVRTCHHHVRSRLTPLLVPYSHGSAVRGVDETPGEGAPYQAAPDRPWGRRQGQYSEVRWRRRWRGRPGEKTQQVMAKEQLCSLYSQKGRNYIIFTKVLVKGCVHPCLCPGSFIGFSSMVWTLVRASLGPACPQDTLLCKQDGAGRLVLCGFCCLLGQLPGEGL